MLEQMLLPVRLQLFFGLEVSIRVSVQLVVVLGSSRHGLRNYQASGDVSSI